MSFAALFDYELVGDDFVGLAFDAVAAGVLGAFEAAADIDRAAFGDEAEVGHALGVPCYHIVPGGFDHGFAVAVLVKEIGGEGEPCDLAGACGRNADVADISPQFDSVQLFHSKCFLFGFFPHVVRTSAGHWQSKAK